MSTVQNRLWTSFIVAWISYALTYFLRKPLGVIKTDLEHDLSLSKFQLGLFDTALLLPYALIQTFFGSLGDRYGARRTFGYGLIGSGMAMITFGWWSDYRLFLLLLFLNGAFQSLCWAAANKGLGAWVTDTQRNFIFGLFGTCPFAGGILGTALAVYIQGKDGWRFVHFQPSIYCIIAGFLVLFLFREPSELNMAVTGKESVTKSSDLRSRMTIMEVCRLPMVKEIAATVFCLKVVRYAIYLWLPLYLKQELNYSTSDAGLFSTMFDVGGVAGSATIGYVLKRFFNNEGCLGAGVETLLSAGTLLSFLAFAKAGITINSILMLITGALNCGADIILCSSVPIEIGEMDGRNAGSAVIGFVNGIFGMTQQNGTQDNIGMK
ncbi:unnamed protein product [Rotaria sordida]|uniref:Major facilitator superfamily (MFS) profile domain-containing protein n=1 Tax=Rotaria sordida TaxID=392033 RepID=A0A814I5M2_9BILA|nr:unnamed protein product [Rotaria sordida]CAF3905950.1 unnamed protein product [Rotaria sordida]